MEPCYAQAIGTEPQWSIGKTVSDSRTNGTPKSMLLFGGRGSREGSKVRVTERQTGSCIGQQARNSPNPSRAIDPLPTW